MQKLDPAFDEIGGDGIVSIALESGRKMSLTKKIVKNYIMGLYDPSSQNLTLVVRNGEFSRSFKPVSYNDGYPCWNQQLNIPVHVYPTKNHPLNSLIFTIELSNVFPSQIEEEEKEEEKEIIGSLILHLYDIIPLNEYESSFNFYQKNTNITGSISMKIRFMYGTYGYGYSMQINDQSLQAKSKNKNILFPRIEPKTFGKDYIDGDKDDIIASVTKNQIIEDKYLEHIKYLFNLEKYDLIEGLHYKCNQLNR